jgi:TonB family protein
LRVVRLAGAGSSWIHYTEEAKQAHLEGSVLLDCVVASNGIPRDISVSRSLDALPGLDQAVIEALEHWRFKPGTKRRRSSGGKRARRNDLHAEMTTHDLSVPICRFRPI